MYCNYITDILVQIITRDIMQETNNNNDHPKIVS